MPLSAAFRVVDATTAVQRLGHRPRKTPHQVVPFSWRKGGPYQVAQTPQSGPYQLAHDKQDLKSNGIETLPRFDQIAIDDEIRVRAIRPRIVEADYIFSSTEPAGRSKAPGAKLLDPSSSRPDEGSTASKEPGAESPAKAAVTRPEDAEIEFQKPFEVTIGTLPSAGSGLEMVRPQTSILEAIGLMESRDFSQLGVGSGRELKGSISWEDVTRARYRSESELVQHAMAENPIEVSFSEPLLQHVATIARKGFVFVRGKDNLLTGIVTSADLSVRFEELATPFLLIGQIEGWLRETLDWAFSTEQLGAAVDDDSDDREVESAKDLTFGEYLRLLQQPDNWNQVGWDAHRSVFCDHLDEVREIRNEVMHFSPDPISGEQITKIANLLQWIQRIAASS